MGKYRSDGKVGGGGGEDFVKKIKRMKLLGGGYLSQMGATGTAHTHSRYIKCQIWKDIEKTAVGIDQ